MKTTHYITLLVAGMWMCAGGCDSRQPSAAASIAKVTPAQLRAFLPEAVPDYAPDPSAAIPDTEGSNIASACRWFVGAAPGSTLGLAILFDGDDTRSETKRRDSVAGGDPKTTVRDFPAIEHASQNIRQLMVFTGRCTVVITGPVGEGARLRALAEKMDLPALARLGKSE